VTESERATRSIRERFSSGAPRGYSVDTVVRTNSPFAVLALLSATAVLAAIVGVKSGAMTPLAAKVVLGVAIPIFFGAFLGAIPRGRKTERRGGWRGVVGPPASEDDLQRPSEAEGVYAWRNARLLALGVAQDTAMLLGAHPTFSVQELEGLLEAGCPLNTAVRILWPA
jgi:hypothetical protein